MDSVLLSLGLNPSKFDSVMAASGEKIDVLEKKWVGVGKTFGSVNREMLREQKDLYSALDRLTDQQQRGQLERLANFRPEIILQREILGLKQSIANIEGTTTQKVELQIELEQKVLQLEKQIANEAARAAAAKEAAAAASKAGIGSASSSSSAAPGDVERVLERKFGARDAMKGLLQGAGIASVQAIADALVAPFKSSAESAEKIADYTEKSVVATRALLDLRLTDAQKIKQLESESARDLREASKMPELTFWQKTMASIALSYGQVGMASSVIINQDAVALQQAKAAADVETRALEVERLKSAEKEKAARRAEQARVDSLQDLSNSQKVNALQEDIDRLLSDYVANQKDLVAQEKIKIQLGERDRELKTAVRDLQRESNLDAQEQIEMARLHLTALARPLTIAEAERLQVLNMQISAMKIQAELAPLIAKGIQNLTPVEATRFQTLVHQGDQLQKQIVLKEKIIDATKTQVAAEEKVAVAIESNTAAWDKFVISVSSFGRGDKQLSDRELARKIQETKKDIFNRTVALNQQPASVGGDPHGYDPFLEQQKYNLSQALKDQDFRRNVRRTAATNGEDAAFNLFPGLTEQRFREILGSGDHTQKVVDAFQTFNDQQRRGFDQITATLKDVAAAARHT